MNRYQITLNVNYDYTVEADNVVEAMNKATDEFNNGNSRKHLDEYSIEFRSHKLMNPITEILTQQINLTKGEEK